MEKLKFPIICGHTPDAKRLSMDDYLKFVDFNVKYTLNRKVYKNGKR